MKSPFVAGILILVVILAVGRLIWFYRSQPAPGEPIPHMMPAACDACGANYAAKIGKQPAKCTKCGEAAVWRAFQCLNEDCKTIYPYKDTGGDIANRPNASCPKCGGQAYTTEPPIDDLGKP